MDSAISSGQSPEFTAKAMKTALGRWKLETLTGLLGYKALKHHQSENEKNITAENAAVRSGVWGAKEVKTEDEMGDHIILGDSIHPTPIIMQQAPAQKSSGTLGKVLAGAAAGAALVGIPGAGVAGYFLNQMLSKPAPSQPSSDDTVDIGLLRFDDLKGIQK